MKKLGAKSVAELTKMANVVELFRAASSVDRTVRRPSGNNERSAGPSARAGAIARLPKLWGSMSV